MFNINLKLFLTRRLVLSIVTLFGAVICVFLLTNVLPGNPAEYRAGSFAPEETIRELERQMGLDKPIYFQFTDYLGNLVRGDLGDSWGTRRPVTQDLAQRLPASIELALSGFIIAVFVAFPLGIFAAAYKDSLIDHFCRALTTLSVSIPVFWAGAMLIYIFFFELGWFGAPIGRLETGVNAPIGITGLYVIDSLLTGNIEALTSSVQRLILPSVALSFPMIGAIAKMARTSMLEVLQSDYVRTARSLGLTRGQAIIQDALQNALIPVITILAIVFGFLIAGTVIVEMIFSWPGVGRYAWNAMITNDFNAVRGFLLFVALGFVLLNLTVDILYGLIDPRIRLSKYSQ